MRDNVGVVAVPVERGASGLAPLQRGERLVRAGDADTLEACCDLRESHGHAILEQRG